MGQMASVYARKPETKNENSASRMRKTGLSQPVKSPADRILFLQRTIGNQAVQRLIKSGALQAKLAVNPPGDIYEQEADLVARQVVSQINQPVSRTIRQSKPVQRQGLCKEEKCGQMKSSDIQLQAIPKEEEEEEKLMKKDMVQRKEANGGWTAAPELENSIQQARGSGQPLPENMREPMETAFGADFSGVRVHTDTHSDMLNHSLQARAFTMGKDLFFKQGEYDPGSSAGQELIAHELTHVVQQNGLATEIGQTVQKKQIISGEKCAGLNGLDLDEFNTNAKKAYELLKDDRKEFKAIDKSGGSVNAEMDDQKRVTSATQQVKNLKVTRDQSLQTTIGWLGNLEEGDMKKGDNGGHLLASSQGGPAEWGNMVPQSGPENKWGDWRKFEKENKVEVTANPNLWLRVDLGYPGNSVRPDSWKAWVMTAKSGGTDSNWYEGNNP